MEQEIVLRGSQTCYCGDCMLQCFILLVVTISYQMQFTNCNFLRDICMSPWIVDTGFLTNRSANGDLGMESLGKWGANIPYGFLYVKAVFDLRFLYSKVSHYPQEQWKGGHWKLTVI